MVVVRFQRIGTKKTPHHRIVVTERSRAQSGRVIEIVGTYDPSKEPAMFTVKEDRLAHWVSRGAQVSESLGRLLRRQPKLAALARR